MSKIAWMLVILVFAASCSGSKTSTLANSEPAQIDLSGSDDFNDSDDALADNQIESDDNLLSLDAGESDSLSGPLGNSSPEITSNTMRAVRAEVGRYVVQKNETLMMISFKIYGDYSKWRRLAKMNKKHVKNGIVRAGVTIKYRKPSEEFVWQPQGNPYLIKNGDTLGTISNDVYGTQKKWKAIWENNRPLIKNPNRIFAGFTLYYLDQGSVASSQTSPMEL
jgi:nucleoid-associated protein YgaU